MRSTPSCALARNIPARRARGRLAVSIKKHYQSAIPDRCRHGREERGFRPSLYRIRRVAFGTAPYGVAVDETVVTLATVAGGVLDAWRNRPAAGRASLRCHCRQDEKIDRPVAPRTVADQLSLAPAAIAFARRSVRNCSGLDAPWRLTRSRT
jgi:hypothetical protein